MLTCPPIKADPSQLTKKIRTDPMPVELFRQDGDIWPTENDLVETKLYVLENKGFLDRTKQRCHGPV